MENKMFEVCEVLGLNVSREQVIFEDRGVPHVTRSLQNGKMAIYMFEYEGEFLKIGKAGPNSNARFNSQHYLPKSSRSNLAASLLADEDFADLGFTESTVGEWIKSNVHRIDILLDESLGIFILDLFEACLHCLYHPKYEGFATQRK